MAYAEGKYLNFIKEIDLEPVTSLKRNLKKQLGKVPNLNQLGIYEY